MVYKGIIFDIDGTAVPLGAMEASKRLRNAIKQAQSNIHLAAATGRSIGYAKPVIESLGLIGPCAIMNGAAVIDSRSFEVLWEKPMLVEQVVEVASILQDYQAAIHFCDDATNPVKLTQGALPNTPLLIVYGDEMMPDQAMDLAKRASEIEDVVAHTTPSWSRTGRMDVHITHALGTKRYGIEKIRAMWSLEPAELIGVGDGENDIPIFDAVVHRIAMDNATDKIKALADEVAPSVEEDGLAMIIEKYS